jgi:hypothetical protein
MGEHYDIIIGAEQLDEDGRTVVRFVRKPLKNPANLRKICEPCKAQGMPV